MPWDAQSCWAPQVQRLELAIAEAGRTPCTLQAAWRRAAKEVGTDATPHDLRHYFASVHIAGGTSITKLSRMLGHKHTSETLDTYGHLMGDESEHARQVMQDALTKNSNSRATVGRLAVVAEDVSAGQAP